MTIFLRFLLNFQNNANKLTFIGYNFLLLIMFIKKNIFSNLYLQIISLTSLLHAFKFYQMISKCNLLILKWSLNFSSSFKLDHLKVLLFTPFPICFATQWILTIVFVSKFLSVFLSFLLNINTNEILCFIKWIFIKLIFFFYFTWTLSIRACLSCLRFL